MDLFLGGNEEWREGVMLDETASNFSSFDSVDADRSFKFGILV